MAMRNIEHFPIFFLIICINVKYVIVYNICLTGAIKIRIRQKKTKYKTQ